MKSLTALLAIIAPVYAGLRFPCSELSVQRLDPVVEPGKTPSSHLHHIVGGNAFNATMLGDVGARATCTTCQMAEDFSNYWTAHVFFKHPNGSYHRVPNLPVSPLLGGSNGAVGGITVYYTQHDLSTDNLKQNAVKTFQPGFRMTVGNPTNTGKPQVGLRYQCLSASGGRSFPELSDFPPQACPGGIFTTHHFPACWDGKNLDSPDHQSHMYNTITSDGFVAAGPCPSSHPVRMPQVTFETVWDTSKLNSLWKTGDPNPYVWSFEGTGAGTHADYMFGWKGDALQRAMNKSECFYDGCGSITKQPMATANQCSIQNTVTEKTEGWLPALPGMA
ncbi:uncharacterized protein LY89DRAFT_725727 [Mollisia scopiformis]|uniref:DUF1996 domain-containing protein n=1 Tax=Mollisia scopiformis TaxID=149040 RepID=A0A132B5J4_MOLSC|nr:uncharacterized protein LY89DRAFT_725727 [Mollisia scopiformis]KUJ07611.1 hypothetical protein LY89DRAFT_725727 [Mollisia scopiformis]